MGLMKKLTSSLVASSLVLGLVGSAFAAPTADATNAAFERLNHYNIVKGKLRPDGTVDPALAETITRAELVTVIVRAFGQDDNAKLLNGAASFNDVATNEWYSGYVALAKKMAESKGITMGYEDGSFKPVKNVSSVEALAFIMKFLGVKPGTGANWAADTIKAAIEAGVITSADAEVYLDAPNSEASRGLAFALADNIFYGYNKLPGGKSIYTAYVDTQAPEVTLDKVEPTTTATTAKISGKASGDYVTLMVGTEKVTPNEDGTFAAEVKLAVGENTINVIAKDLAGNEGVASTIITRTAGNAAKIEATLGAGEVEAGGVTELTIKVLDANDAEVAVPEADIKVTTAEGFGTYAEGKFTAGTKAGTGTITVSYGEFTTAVELKIVAAQMAKVEAETASVAPGKAVKLIAKDAYGNPVDGATFSETSSDAFIDGDQFTAVKAGSYAVKATKGELVVEGTIGVYGGIHRLAVSAPESFIANDASYVTVDAKAVDEAGNLILGYDKDVTVVLPGGVTAEKNIVKAVNGVATFKVKGDATLADAEIDLTFKTTYDSKDYTGTASLIGVAQVATALKIEAPEFLPTNDPAEGQDVTISVIDQVGKPMVDGAWSVGLKLTGPAAFADGETSVDEIVVAGGSKVAVFPDGSGDLGSVGMTASFTGLQTATATLKAAYAQTASRVVLKAAKQEVTVADLAGAKDSKIKFTVQTVDKNGVPTKINAPEESVIKFADASATKTFISADGTTFTDIDGAVKRTIDLENGAGAFYVAGVKAGTFSVTATAGKLTESTAISVATKAGAASYVGFNSQTLNVLRSTDAQATFSAQLYDEYGNKASASGKEIKFAIPETAGVLINGKKTEAKVGTDGNGVAPVTLTLAPYAEIPSGLAVAVTSTDADIDPAPGTDLGAGAAPVSSVTVKLANRIAASVSLTVVDADNTKRLSSYAVDSDPNGVGLLVTVKDNYGIELGGLTKDDFSVTVSDDTDLDSIAIAPATATGTYLVTGIKPEKIGSVIFTVKIKTVAADVSSSRTLSVRAGAPNTLSVAELKSSVLTVKKNTPTEMTIIVTDAKGNQATPASVTKDIEIELSGVKGGNGTYVAFQNASNVPIVKAVIKAGTSSVKVKVVTDSDAPFTITLDPSTTLDGFNLNAVTINGSN